MNQATRNLLTAFARMSNGLTPAQRYDLACWLRDKRRYLHASLADRSTRRLLNSLIRIDVLGRAQE